MSIFNVGTGREPAEIGVAEYQKPDYQQFEKLANVNMQLKQAELEKAQKKTKEWEDILTKDYSTEYTIEQSQLINKRMGNIKERILNDWSKNPSLANDPTYMFKVKSEINQVGVWVKSLDIQHKNILETRKKIEEDTKGIAYDKSYATDYLKAQENPEEFFSKNPDGEVGKLIEGIINTPQIQAIKDPDERRMVIREAMQASPMKRGTIATDTTPSLTLKFDDVDAKSKDGTSSGYSEVSRPNRISSLMGYVVGKSDPIANKTYVEIWKDKIEHKTDGNYNQYLEQVRSDYANDIAEMTKDYTGKDEQLEMIKKMPDPATATEEDLIRYDYARNYETQFRSRQERASSPKINVYNNTGDGNTPKTSGSISAINKVSVPKVGGGYDEIDIPETVIVPRKDDTEIRLDITYGMGADGSLFGVESSGLTANVQAKMGDSKLLIVPVYENKTWKNKKSKIKHRIPLSAEDQQDMINNPSAWEGKVKFVTIITHRGETTQGGVKKVDNSFGYAKDNGTAFQAILKEAREQNYKGVIPTQVEYGLKDGLKIYNQLSAPKPF
jgi:hypothetical protein